MTERRTRPLYTPEIAQEICRRLTEGEILKITCRDAEMEWNAERLAAFRGRANRPPAVDGEGPAAHALNATTLRGAPLLSPVSQ